MILLTSSRIVCPLVIDKLPHYYICSSIRTIFTSLSKKSSAMNAEKRELESGENDIETTLQVEKSKRFKTNNQFVEASLDASDYYIENGLRKVYPYEYTFQSYCKGRWVGRNLSELFEKEFRAVTEDIMVCIFTETVF